MKNNKTNELDISTTSFPHVRYMKSFHNDSVMKYIYIGKEYEFVTDEDGYVECHWVSYSPDAETKRKDIICALDKSGKYIEVEKEFWVSDIVQLRKLKLKRIKSNRKD